MRISTKIEPISRDIRLLIDADLSPEAQSQVLAEYAAEEIAAAAETNRQVLGGEAAEKTVIVDGRVGAALETVRPDGVIVAEFHLIADVIAWIGAQLVQASPVRSGRYQNSHVMFVDGREMPLGAEIDSAREVAFVNVQPYARKIERGASAQAPEGVYMAVAELARRRFGNIARIFFDYQSVVGGSRNKADRNPAIIVQVG